MKAGGIDRNYKAVLNIPVAKIFIADLGLFGLQNATELIASVSGFLTQC